MQYLCQLSYFTILAIFLSFVALTKGMLGTTYLPQSMVYMYSFLLMPYLYYFVRDFFSWNRIKVAILDAKL